MPLVVNLSPEVESALRAEAATRGMETEAFVREIIVRRLRRPSRHIQLTPEENNQITTLNAELSLEFWTRYQQLQDSLRSAGTAFPESERAELIALTERAEAWNVRRITLLEAMAQKRGVHFPQLMRSLGIRHHPHTTGA
jgi:plasmid stability protein